MPLITVLMPVFNSERFVGEAIESVLNQTFQDFEFLIIDDCSSDDSVRIIDSFKDPRIRFYQNEKNEGISSTLNKGIDLATCQLIARMDSDDICYAGRLEKQYNFILDRPDGALFTCAAVEVNEERVFIRKDSFNPDYFYFNMTFSVWIYHPTMIYRKEAVQAIGKYTVKYAEDWELAWQLSRRFKIYHQTDILLEYRISSNSISNVTHRKEYAVAMSQQALRNIRYFLGEKVLVSGWVLQCLLNVEDAVQKKFTIREALEAIKILDRLTEKTMTAKNINCNPSKIKSAANEKKDFMLNVFLFKLVFPKGMLLLLLTGRLKQLYSLVVEKLKSRMVPCRHH